MERDSSDDEFLDYANYKLPVDAVNSSDEEREKEKEKVWEKEMEASKIMKVQQLENGKFHPSKTQIQLEFFNQKVLIKQDARECCGGYLWRCATILLNYLESPKAFPPDHFKNKRILELGAGTGLVGIALAKAGAHAILTDQKSMVPLMKENAILNDIPESQFESKELFWGTEDSSQFKDLDYLIAADCIYLEVAFEPLIQTLLDLSSEETVSIVAYQKRRSADKRFWKSAQKKFDITKVSTDLYAKSKSEPVQIFHLKKKKKNINIQIKFNPNHPADGEDHRIFL